MGLLLPTNSITKQKVGGGGRMREGGEGRGGEIEKVAPPLMGTFRLKWGTDRQGSLKENPAFARYGVYCPTRALERHPPKRLQERYGTKSLMEQ